MCGGRAASVGTAGRARAGDVRYCHVEKKEEGEGEGEGEEEEEEVCVLTLCGDGLVEDKAHQKDRQLKRVGREGERKDDTASSVCVLTLRDDGLVEDKGDAKDNTLHRDQTDNTRHRDAKKARTQGLRMAQVATVPVPWGTRHTAAHTAAHAAAPGVQVRPWGERESEVQDNDAHTHKQINTHCRTQ